MVRRLFGTDGVRGRAGELLSTALAHALGAAAVAEQGAAGARLLVIRDTRESGPELEAAFAEGAAEAGANVTLGGVLPTPAAPLSIAGGRFDLAAVISASHNPFEDNGIKLFGPGGLKLGDDAERGIERRVADGRGAAAAEPGTIVAAGGLGEFYLAALAQRFAALDLSGRTIALDCAHGATHEVAPTIFRRLGGDVVVLGDAPDGRNINAGCGSTHPGPLTQVVRDGRAELGFAFDGDGDRVIAVDEAGEVVDGDRLIALAALALKQAGALDGDGIAVTVMSNYGLRAAMQEAGIAVTETAVGDRHVLTALREHGLRLGGEQSGHIIDMAFVPSGDGIASALLTLESLAGRRLRDVRPFAPLAQALSAVPVRDRDAVSGDAELAAAITAEDRAFAGHGRVLVRPSGTEQVVRVLVEATGQEQADAACDRLGALIRARHGD